MEYLIGIDSGGTHIEARSYDLEGNELQKASEGPGNSLIDAEGTLTRLKSCINNLIEKHNNIYPKEILIGVAGVATAGNSDWIKANLSKDLDHKVSISIVNDAELALINGLKGNEGTLVIAGTGSIVFGRINSDIVRVGGWGQVLGDEGSAYAIAVRAVKTLLNRHDQGIKYPLNNKILEFFEASDIAEMVRNFYSLDREEIAKLTKVIASEAKAQEIFAEEASILANQVITLIKRMGENPPMELALSGSVLVKNQKYFDMVVNQIKKSFPEIHPIIVDTNNSRAVLYFHKWKGIE